MSKHVGSGQARTGKVRLIIEDSSYPLGQLRIHGITRLQSHVSEEVAGPSGWYAVARIDRQTQDRLAIDAQPQQSALQSAFLSLAPKRSGKKIGDFCPRLTVPEQPCRDQKMAVVPHPER